MEHLDQPTMAFVRLAHGTELENVVALPIPVRFVFVLLGPSKPDFDYHEVGRSISTLMADEVGFVRDSGSSRAFSHSDFISRVSTSCFLKASFIASIRAYSFRFQVVGCLSVNRFWEWLQQFLKRLILSEVMNVRNAAFTRLFFFGLCASFSPFRPQITVVPETLLVRISWPVACCRRLSDASCWRTNAVIFLIGVAKERGETGSPCDSDLLVWRRIASHAQSAQSGSASRISWRTINNGVSLVERGISIVAWSLHLAYFPLRVRISHTEPQQNCSEQGHCDVTLNIVTLILRRQWKACGRQGVRFVLLQLAGQVETSSDHVSGVPCDGVRRRESQRPPTRHQRVPRRLDRPASRSARKPGPAQEHLALPEKPGQQERKEDAAREERKRFVATGTKLALRHFYTPPGCSICKIFATRSAVVCVRARAYRCQAKFLTSRHMQGHRVIFYISNTLRKLMIRA